MRPLHRLPRWLKATAPGSQAYVDLRNLVSGLRLHTVCESAHCPNMGECWGHRTATFMILGDVCTRNCGFCAIESGRPGPPDEQEPERVAEAVAHLQLRHAVVTSVSRDDLPDGGASIFARTIAAMRQACPQTTVEVLVPDFKGSIDALDMVLAAGPDILNHNIETVPRLYPTMRPQARYGRSLQVLRHAAEHGPAPTKSGLMLGAGERHDEVAQTLRDLADAGCSILTLGQYLAPSPRHVAVERFVPPEEFEDWRHLARSLGFRHVESGPLVRSSYRAEKQVDSLRLDHGWTAHATPPPAAAQRHQIETTLSE